MPDPLTPDQFIRLAENLNSKARRRPQDQAAVLLERALGIRSPEPATRTDSGNPARAVALQA